MRETGYPGFNTDGNNNVLTWDLKKTVYGLILSCKIKSFSDTMIYSVDPVPPRFLEVFRNLSWWSESLPPPLRGEKQFWEFAVFVQFLKNIWIKGGPCKPPPTLCSPSTPSGGCEWGLADGKQTMWPINLSLLRTAELSGEWRQRGVGLVGEVHDR